MRVPIAVDQLDGDNIKMGIYKAFENRDGLKPTHTAVRDIKHIAVMENSLEIS